MLTALTIFATVDFYAQQVFDQAKLHFDLEKEIAFYDHEVRSGETLYRLSKLYGSPVPAIMYANDMKTPALSPGQQVIIPFNESALHYSKSSVPADKRIPVVYAVRKKETVYRICRKYFDVNLTAVKELNAIRQNTLDIGQELTLGFLLEIPEAEMTRERLDLTNLAVEPIILSATGEENVDRPETGIEFTSIDTDEANTYSINYENGAAFWDKAATGLNGHYVLHRYAEPNTWIEVKNPMYKTSIQARVIGNIPEGTYPEDVLVVVSPSIAKDLGAIDERFYVKVRYLRVQSKMTADN